MGIEEMFAELHKKNFPNGEAARKEIQDGEAAWKKIRDKTHDERVKALEEKSIKERIANTPFKDKVRSLARNNLLDREQMNDALDPGNESKWKYFIDKEYERTTPKESISAPNVSPSPVRVPTPVSSSSSNEAPKALPLSASLRKQQATQRLAEIDAAKKSISNPISTARKARSSSPQNLRSSLLQTIQSIQSNPAQLQKERQRAVSVNSRMSSVPQEWNKREVPFTGPDIEESEVRVPKERKGFVDPNMKLSSVSDTANISHGAVYTQQADQAIARAALEAASEPIDPYLGQTIANLHDFENRARNMALHESPYFNKDNLDTEEQIREHLKQASNMPGTSDVANPYLTSMTKNPADAHEKLLGPMERAQLESIREESDRNLYDKLLPELKRKYMVPGMKRSGHQGKEVRDLIRDYSKGRTNALNQAMTTNRLGTLGVSQKHADTLGNAASQSSSNQQKDILKEFDAARLKNAALQDRSKVRKAHRDEVNTLGLQDRGITQQKLNEDLKKFTDEQNHKKNQLLFASSLVNHTPMQVTGGVNALPVNPALNGPNSSHLLAGGLSGLGVGQMPRQNVKKGGTIKARPRYADGGQIMREAISNAVIDKDDPLTALRRLMNRQRMMDVSETKIGKRRYRDGGQVNPIQAGANQAREFLGEKDLRAHIESRKTPYQKPMITSMADDFMRGMASVGGTSGLARMAQAYHSVAQNKDAEHQRGREQKHKAFEDIYKLDQDAKKSEADLRKEAFEERKYHADEKYRRDALAQTGEYQRGTLANKNAKEKKLTRADQEILVATTKSLAAAPDLLDDLARIKELSMRLKTGTLRTQLNNSSPYMMAKMGVGDQADIEEYIKLTSGLATKAAAVFGARAGANVVKLFKQEKPNIDMTPEAIRGIVDKMTEQVERGVQRSYHVQEALDEGISPSKALVDFDKQLKIEHDAKIKAKADEEAKKYLGARPVAPVIAKPDLMDNPNYLGAPEPVRPSVPTKKEPVYLGSAQPPAEQSPAAPEEENAWGTPKDALDNSALIDTSALTDTSAALESLNAKKARLAQLESGRR